MTPRRSAAELFQRDLHSWRLTLAQALLDTGDRDLRRIGRQAWLVLDAMLFVRACEVRAVLPEGGLRRLAVAPAPLAALERYGGLGANALAEAALTGAQLSAIVSALYQPVPTRVLADRGVDVFGQLYEHHLTHPIRLAADGSAGDVGEARERGRLRVGESPAARRQAGVYYTPQHIVAHVVANTVGALFAGKTPRQVRGVKIVDPACGAGAFLLGVYQYLQSWYRDVYLRAGRGVGAPEVAGEPPNPERLEEAPGGGWRLTLRERVEILKRHLYGVDIDADAVALTRRALTLEAVAGAATREVQPGLFPELDWPPPVWPDLSAQLRVGNALIGTDIAAAVSASEGSPDTTDTSEAARAAGARGGDADPPVDIAALKPFDWRESFPEVFERTRGGFDAVLGNPPWGQKGIAQHAQVSAYLRARFESLSGIFDSFRPFVEQGVKLLRRGSGRFGMVLPDIILLKDYPATRRYLLDHLTLTHIDWWGMAFPGAVIDAVTILGQRRRARRTHTVGVTIHEGGDKGEAWAHRIPQRVFRTNDRYVFNLLLTQDRRRVLDRLADLPRLGSYYEVHEGVHSGNMRAALFVDEAIDDSCQPMYFGRGELGRYRLTWRGRYLRLSALPQQRSRERYANVGRPEWFAPDKLLVRRTGDRVIAAVDRSGRYASNNFFVVLPRADADGGGLALGLDGLCALLSSRLMTWYFRTIEPRKGRAFAELKIKHLTVFPLPAAISDMRACADIESFGRERARIERERLAVDAADEPESTDAGLAEQAEKLDLLIDRAVYALYGLREADIRIVERS
ncbi:MAG: hypothetical protein Tsb0020_49250 [Haliangiales bacterium]